MTPLRVSPKDFTAKLASARKDIPDLTVLRAQAPPSEGAAFLVMKTLFIWISTDRTPDDGVDSIRPSAISEGSPGRFRRAGFGIVPA